jgi:DNA-binding transcriptional LysR family regulator
MKLEHLTTFLTAAEDLNFTHAARRLFLSQSAVSQQIRELEEDLGVTLFERRGRGLLLTPAGERLRAKAKPIMRDVRHARESLGEFRAMPQGVIRVGASNTPGIYLLPYALGRFAERFPGVRISLRVGDGSAITRAIQDGELDLALLEDDPSPGRLPGWEQRELLQDELALIARPDHPWARRTDLTVTDLPDHPIIFRQADSPTRQLILDRIAQAGMDPDRLSTLFELGNTEAIKRAVMAGLGVGWVSRYACALERKAGWLVEVPVAGVVIGRPLWLLLPPPDRSLIHQQRFADLLLKDDWLPPDLADVRPVEALERQA